MAKEVLKEIDNQIISWVEELDKLYEERAQISRRIPEIEERLNTLTKARAELAMEWGEESVEIPVPLRYSATGVSGAIQGILERETKPMTVDAIVNRLLTAGFDFGGKNPRRVVNMALVNSPLACADETGKLWSIDIEPEDIPF